MKSDLLKQQEKLKAVEIINKEDIWYTDVEKFNTFCNMLTFNIYMYFQPLNEQLEKEKICKKIADLYLEYD